MRRLICLFKGHEWRWVDRLKPEYGGDLIPWPFWLCIRCKAEKT